MPQNGQKWPFCAFCGIYAYDYSPYLQKTPEIARHDNLEYIGTQFWQRTRIRFRQMDIWAHIRRLANGNNSSNVHKDMAKNIRKIMREYLPIIMREYFREFMENDGEGVEAKWIPGNARMVVENNGEIYPKSYGNNYGENYGENYGHIDGRNYGY